MFFVGYSVLSGFSWVLITKKKKTFLMEFIISALSPGISQQLQSSMRLSKVCVLF